MQVIFLSLNGEFFINFVNKVRRILLFVKVCFEFNRLERKEI